MASYVSELNVPQANPYNLQAVKRYIFNETGNIMLASTAIASDQIQQSVRDVFAEVAVFFAAMTKAISTTIDPVSKQPYSIYDYKAIQSIIDGSGLFVQVTASKVHHSSSSFGLTLSRELIEGLLGLATGEGELSFAEAMLASMGQRGITISNNSWKSDSRVANIVFICEYLMGMPVVSAMVVYVCAKEYKHQFKAGPCISESDTKFDMVMNKDTYMFVTPKFIKEYSGDLLSAESNLQFEEFVDYLRDLVERKPVITAVDSMDGNPAPSELKAGSTYAILGSFLRGSDPVVKTNPVLKFTEESSSEAAQGSNPPVVTVAEVQDDVITFTVSGTLTSASPIGIYADAGDTTPFVTTALAYTVA